MLREHKWSTAREDASLRFPLGHGTSPVLGLQRRARSVSCSLLVCCLSGWEIQQSLSEVKSAGIGGTYRRGGSCLQRQTSGNATCSACILPVVHVSAARLSWWYPSSDKSFSICYIDQCARFLVMTQFMNSNLVKYVRYKRFRFSCSLPIPPTSLPFPRHPQYPAPC